MVLDRLRSVLAISATLVSIAACGERPQAGAPTTVRDSLGVAIVETDFRMASAVCEIPPQPSVSIGVAEGADEYMFYRVFGSRQLSDGRIAVVNQGSQQVRFYDSEGRFLHAAGREGEGPGEFRDAFYIWRLRGDTLWVGDYRPWQFLVFEPDGEWVRTVRPSPQYVNSPALMTVLVNGRSVLAERTRGAPERGRFALRESTVVVHDEDGAVMDTIGTYPAGRWGQMEEGVSSPFLYPFFESFPRLSGAGTRIVVGHTSRPELSIYDLSAAPRLERVIRWATDDRSISGADLAAQREKLSVPYEDLDAETRRRFLGPLIHEDRPVADEFPAFSNVMMGQDGRIWIQDYVRPTDASPHLWFVLNEEGHFECRAEVPEFQQLHEFGSNYLLSLERDELDVERVLRYSIAGPIP